MDERTIFLKALDQEDPAGRRAYLDAACAGNPTLRKRVEALLRSHEHLETFLDVPALEQIKRDDQALATLRPSNEPGALGRLDHYEILDVIGRGSTGVVLRARDTNLQRIVAIKMLAPRLAASASARRRFVQEAQAAAAVRDDHVVAIYAVSDEGPSPYLVMEYIAGITLNERIKQNQPLQLVEIQRIGMQVARGLAAAHAQGLIHRDIKPGNILLENGVQRVKITDFGLARAAADPSLAPGGAIAGTPLFMSPEQARGEAIDCRSDLFSLGSVLYSLCTGQPPFPAATTAEVLKEVCQDTPRPIREVNPDVPDWLCDLIAKLQAREPNDRFASAREVADLLGRRLALLQLPPAKGRIDPAPAPRNGIESITRRVVADPSIAPPSRRKRLLLVLCLAGLLIVLGALAAYWKLWRYVGLDSEFDGQTPDRDNRPLAPLDRRRENITPTLLTLAGGAANTGGLGRRHGCLTKGENRRRCNGRMGVAAGELGRR
jgi:serine/threonine protein kinase